MFAKQLTVFIENRTGRLSEVLGVLKDNNVNIISMSLADTTEYGLLRLIVNDPERGKAALMENGFSSMTTDVLVVKIPHAPGSLRDMLEFISEGDVSVEYLYGLSIEGDNASVVMKTNDLDKAMELLRANNFDTMNAEEISKL